MESSSIGSLGVYLLLAFVLPGFCYLFVFALCFPDLVKEGVQWLATLSLSQANSVDARAEASSEKTPPLLSFAVGVGVVGGLLLSSVTFVIEIALRRLWPFCGVFERLYPNMHVERIGQIEAAGKGSFYLHVLSGSALMHFNVGMGILLILIAYVSYMSAHDRQLMAARVLCLLVCLSIVAAANMVDSGRLFRVARDAITLALNAPAPSARP
jgi:hypothetical protein